MLEERNINAETLQKHEASETLMQLADGTEELTGKERQIFSPVLKKWHPVAAGVAAVALHECYGTLLKQYLAGVTSLTNETVLLLQKAGKLEKVLLKMVAEDTEECEDGGKAMIREMASYEVDSVVISLLRQWIQEKLKKCREIIHRAKDTEASSLHVLFHGFSYIISPSLFKVPCSCFPDMESKVEERTIRTVCSGANEAGQGSCGQFL